MIPKEIKYNLHYDDVRGDFLRSPHGTTQAIEVWSISISHRIRLHVCSQANDFIKEQIYFLFLRDHWVHSGYFKNQIPL